VDSRSGCNDLAHQSFVNIVIESESLLLGQQEAMGLSNLWASWCGHGERGIGWRCDRGGTKGTPAIVR